MVRLVVLVGVFAGVCAPLLGQPTKSAQQAREVFQKHCSRCHGEKGAVEGGLNYLLDARQLIARKKVLPGNPQKSPLLERVHRGEMPPEDVKARPGPAEVAVLERWIKDGAEELLTPEKPRAFLTHQAIVGTIAKDLEKMDAADHQFLRYFTLDNFYNEGVTQEEMETYRHALSKVVNGLSWGPRIAVPVAVDAERTILRVDIRKYGWSTRTWALFTGFYPYELSGGSDVEKKCAEAMQTRNFYVRADWFAAHIGSDKFYYIGLEMPLTLTELEKKLRVNVADNVKSGEARRAGFDHTLVAKNIRLIERHESLFGAYWLSYNQGGSGQPLAKQALATPARPTGSGTNNVALFHLPNGMIAFMAASPKGQRDDFANGVHDPRRTDRPVRMPMSCISCHTQGVIARDDQVRALLDDKSQTFTKDAAEMIRQLYPTKDKMQALVDEDVERYREALKQAGVVVGTADPVVALVLRHQENLDLQRVAIELGMSEAQFVEKMKKVSTLDQVLMPLTEGGKINRAVFAANYPRFSKSGPEAGSLGVGRQGPEAYPEMLLPLRGKFVPRLVAALVPLLPTFKPTPRLEPRPASIFKGHATVISSLFATRDGALVLTGGEDASVRLFDGKSGDALASMSGHTKTVRSAVLSPDRKFVYSADESTLRVFDVGKGTQTMQVPLPNFASRSAFAPDGKTLAVGSSNGAVHLLDPSSGKTTRSMSENKKAAAVLAFSPDSRRLAVADQNHIVHLWDLTSGSSQVLKSDAAHDGLIRDLAFSPDGRLLASGSLDRTICLWDLDAGTEGRRIGTFPSFVNAVTFSPDGRSVFVASGSGGVTKKSKLPPTANFCVVKVDFGSGKVVKHWIDFDDLPGRSVFMSDGRMLTIQGNTLKRWLPD